ncbi:MAG TPA: hypothetical protein VFJ46_17775 [Xanthobacteraceae bacterium]|nr:hypothetical protein [Xanthobacteraceae bacterium]
MSFVSLYRYVAGLNEYPVRLEGIVDKKVQALTGQDEIWYVPVDLDPTISLGHIKQLRYQKLPYQELTWVTEIRYHKELDLPLRRFVCCKELMHAFDTPEERTDSAKKFEQLLDEIETPLPNELASPMFQSESRTKWMAALTLCPGPVRDRFLPLWEADELSDYEVALELQIPEPLIKTIMSDRYERVFDILIGDKLDQLEMSK